MAKKVKKYSRHELIVLLNRYGTLCAKEGLRHGYRLQNANQWLTDRFEKNPPKQP